MAWADPLAAVAPPVAEPPDEPLATASPEVAEPTPQLKIWVSVLMTTVIGAKFCPPTWTATLALVWTSFCATSPWACEAPLAACVVPAGALPADPHAALAHAAPETVDAQPPVVYVEDC